MSKRVEKQSVKNKKLSTASIVLLAACIVLIGGVIATNFLTQKAMNDQKDIILSAIQLREGSQYLTSEIRAYAASGRQRHYDNYWNEVNNVKSRDKAVENAEKIGITQQEKDMIGNISSQSNNLIPLEEAAMEAVENGDLQKAMNLVYGDEYQNGIDSISDDTEAFIQALSERVQLKCDTYSAAGLLVECVALAAIFFIIAIQFIYLKFVRKELIEPVQAIEAQMDAVSNGILDQEFTLVEDTSEIGSLVGSIHNTKKYLQNVIGEISESMEKLSDGNMNFRLKVDYRGQFVKIGESIEGIIRKLNETFKMIQESAGQVAGNAESMSEGAQALADGASDQSSAIEELQATFTDVSDKVQKNAENAQQVNGMARHVGGEIVESNDQMGRMVNAMNEIYDTSKEISKIIATINEIANQTNLLSLNASIEAARAGEMGKGFAVVATEVGALAVQSAEAAKSSNELIASSLKAVESGKEMVDTAAETLNKSAVNIKDMVGNIDEMSEASRQQSEALLQISQAVEQIAAVVAENSATAQQSSASSEEMSAQAQILSQLLSQYQLRKI